jgi:hypothetical protein
LAAASTAQRTGAKVQDRQVFDLGLAAQSVLVYDAVGITVQPLPGLRTSSDWC